ncbi:MAG: hypothetical protein AB7F19_04810 [Candidatus Babeliales bacterium]
MKNNLLISTLFSCLISQFSFAMNLDLGPIKSAKATIDTTDIQAEDYGIINKQVIATIALPTSGKKIIEIIPTQGRYTGKKVKGLFYMLDLAQPLPTDAPANLLAAIKKAKNDPNIGDQGKTIVGIFVQKPNETMWTSVDQMVSIDTPADLQEPGAIKLVLTGNGKVVATLPAFQKAIKDSSTPKIGTTPLTAELGKD